MNLPVVAVLVAGLATIGASILLRLQRPRWAYRTQQAARTKGDAGLGLIFDDLTPDEVATLEPTLHMGGCAHCGGAQGDIATVHYRGLCAVTHTMRPIHWCCPDNNCELTPPFPVVATAEAVDDWTRQVVMDLPTAEMTAVLIELDPAPSRPYIDGPVLLGRQTLHADCLGARRDGTYDRICASCRPSLVGVARETLGGQP